MSDSQNHNEVNAESLMNRVSMRLLRWWGMLFRVLFITLVGIIGYLWMDPQPLGDIPLSQLTLKQIASNIMAVVIPIACFIWLFKLNRKYGDESLPYEDWGRLGGFALLLGFIAFAWFTKK
jgi:hypothetical protein